MSKASFMSTAVSAETPTVPFETTEEAWFWFVRCHEMRRNQVRFADSVSRVTRPCDPDDIYRAAKRLARCGILGDRHLLTLGHFGLVGRPPDARCGDEETSSRLWCEAIDRLETVLRAKHIVG
jgi:hypothetical protein